MRVVASPASGENSKHQDGKQQYDRSTNATDHPSEPQCNLRVPGTALIVDDFMRYEIHIQSVASSLTVLYLAKRWFEFVQPCNQL